MKRIDGIAEALAAEHCTRDPFALCDALGILVYNAPLPESMNGFYFSPDGRGMICIREGMKEPLAKITCAHELGHALLHPSLNLVFMQTKTQMEVEKYEREADCFCACLLLPTDMLKSLRREGGCTVEELMCRTGLPERLIELRLKDFGNIQ